jgi:hypothetical protein
VFVCVLVVCVCVCVGEIGGGGGGGGGSGWEGVQLGMGGWHGFGQPGLLVWPMVCSDIWIGGDLVATRGLGCCKDLQEARVQQGHAGGGWVATRVLL